MTVFLQGVYEGIINGSILALIAMGIALVWGVMNILSFSQGEFLMLGEVRDGVLHTIKSFFEV